MNKKAVPHAPNLRISVTQAHIDDAIPKDSGHCMIADAVAVALPGSARRLIDLQTIRVTDPKRGLRYTYLTPRIAQEALVRWDKGIKPPPFSFVLRGGHVTKAYQRKDAKAISPKQLAARQRAAQKMLDLQKTRLRSRDDHAPVRVGGKTPPLNVPYSRRREFGVRGLALDEPAQANK